MNMPPGNGSKLNCYHIIVDDGVQMIITVDLNQHTLNRAAYENILLNFAPWA